ncbi:hypothetical protein Vretimale_14036, partial [Volvox reticuliferus]
TLDRLPLPLPLFLTSAFLLSYFTISGFDPTYDGHHPPDSIYQAAYPAPAKHNPTAGAGIAVAIRPAARQSSSASSLPPQRPAPGVASLKAVLTNTRTIRRRKRFPTSSIHNKRGLVAPAANPSVPNTRERCFPRPGPAGVAAGAGARSDIGGRG